MQVQSVPPTGGHQVVTELWADLGCPWCYVGKHRLQRAITARPDAERFEVRLRSFELNPEAPREPETIASAFVRSHGGDAGMVRDAEHRMQALSRAEGLEFSLNRLNANTFDIHRLLQFANTEGLGMAFFSLVQDRFFAGDLNPFDVAELTAAAAAAGLPEQRVSEILRSDAHAEAVRADRLDGLALGVRGVPFAVFDGRVALAGAQWVERYGAALQQVAPPDRSADGSPLRPAKHHQHHDHDQDS